MRAKAKTAETLLRKERRVLSETTYTYELFMRESRGVASYRLPLYSIRVGLTDEDGKFTEAEISDAFADAGRAVLFFEKLIKNLATPIDLIYVLDDERA